MRTEQEMMQLILEYAERDERIRLVTMEGSRTNPNITPDQYQDYDLSFFVTDMDAYKLDDDWLDHFGRRLMMQKPEAMELFPPSLGNWFSYLMIFEDGNKLDLTLIPINETEDYFNDSDGLVKVLLDKDQLVTDREITLTDQKYWITQPTARQFDDCCNEYWFVSTYVVKGLARREFLFAVDHLHEIMRPNLLRMMSWQIGLQHGFHLSLGKNYKFIERYLPVEDWNALLSTYRQGGYAEMWHALFTCCELFRKYAHTVSDQLGYSYPDYDENITKYIVEIYEKETLR